MAASRRLSVITRHLRSYSSSTTSGPSGTLTIGLIPADGIGREVIPAAVQVLKHLESSVPNKSWNFKFVELDAGFELFQRTGVALPTETIDTLKNECVGGLFGAVSSPSHKVAGYSSPIVALRKHLDLYANVRPVASPASYNARGEKRPCDMVIVRENTECLYIKKETISETPNGTTALATRQITSRASTRIGRIAFELALQRNARRSQLPASQNWWNKKPKVTVVHKSNVLSVTDGLFRECVLKVGKEDKYKNIVEIEEQLVDSMVYRMFREPHMFDVVVAPNLYGDILSDGAAALVGSLGVVPSANVGDTFVLGEPVHGSAPDIAGRGIANPIAAIRSAGLLLEHLNLPTEAASIYKAVDSVLEESSSNKALVTPDLGGSGKTETVVEEVIKRM